jgi:hypothetical protein
MSKIEGPGCKESFITVPCTKLDSDAYHHQPKQELTSLENFKTIRSMTSRCVVGNEVGNSEDEKIIMDTQIPGENGLSDRAWKLKLYCTLRLNCIFWTSILSHET